MPTTLTRLRESRVSQIKDAVKTYLSEGFAVVPLKAKTKKPFTDDWFDWPNVIFTENAFRQTNNIGLIWGDASKYHVDIDLDDPSAIALAPFILPATGKIFGRKTAPNSHWIYRSKDCEYRKYLEVKQKKMLVELRSTKESDKPNERKQTLAPPSIHPDTGETVTWTTNQAAREIPAEELYKHVTLLAVASQIAVLWPKGKGGRHDLALAVGGYLARRFEHVEPGDIGIITRECAKYGSDDEADDREIAARDSAEKVRKNAGPTTGGPKLGELLGSDVLTVLDKWTGAKDKASKKIVDIYKDADIIDELERINDQCALMTAGGTARIAYDNDQGEGPELKNIEAFKLQFNKHYYVERKLISVADAWLRWPERRMYTGRELCPPPREPSASKMNLWMGWRFDPNESPSPTPTAWLDHLHEIICDKDTGLTEWVLDWCCQMVQCPGQPAGTCVVLRGQEGAGKGAWVQPLLYLLHPYNRNHITSLELLVGRFSGHLAGSVMLYADEAYWGGNRAGAGRLKALITESTISIEEKGMRAERINNCMHIVMASNEDWVVQMDPKARRFLVLDVPDRKIGDRAYFNALHTAFGAKPNGDYDAAFLRGLMSFLTNRKYDRDKMRKPPQTSASEEQYVKSMQGVEEWWLDKLTEGELLGEGWDVTGGKDLYDAYRNNCKDPRRCSSFRGFIIELRRLDPSIICKQQGNKWIFVFPELEVCRQNYDNFSGITRDWKGDTGLLI